MKTLPVPLALLALLVVFARAQNPAGSPVKSNDKVIAAVQAADDERLAAPGIVLMSGRGLLSSAMS